MTDSDLTLTFENETHTIGSLLQYKLLTYPEAVFVAYKVTHPLKKEVQLRVQTDSTISAQDLVKKGINDLIKNIITLEQAIKKL